MSAGVQLDDELDDVAAVSVRVDVARPKKSKDDPFLEMIRKGQVASFDEMFGPSNLPSIEDSPAAEHRPWVPYFRDGLPWNNKPRCPSCDEPSVVPAASIDADWPATHLYCESCGNDVDDPKPAMIAWAWFAFGAKYAHDTEVQIDGGYWHQPWIEKDEDET